MPHNLAHILYELRRKAGKSDFQTEEAVTVIREIKALMVMGVDISIQTQLRGPAYFVSDNGVLRNFCVNPSFEHDLNSWTENITATGSSGLDATQFNQGLVSLLLTMTDSTGSGEVVERELAVITGLASGEVWSVGVEVRIAELTTAKFILRLEFLDGSDVVQATHNVESTSVSTSWIQLNNENRTAPATTEKIRITLIAESTAINATATINVDGVMVEKLSAISTYFDGDSQDCFWEISAHNGESFNDVDGTAIVSGNWKTSA